MGNVVNFDELLEREDLSIEENPGIEGLCRALMIIRVMDIRKDYTMAGYLAMKDEPINKEPFRWIDVQKVKKMMGEWQEAIAAYEARIEAQGYVEIENGSIPLETMRRIAELPTRRIKAETEA